MSTSRFLRAGGAHAVAAGSSLRTIALAVAAFVGLAGVFFLMFGSGGAKVAHAQGQTITAKALTAHECDSTEWHFVINQINTDANAPTSITVEWANGASEVVPLAMFTGKVAHYVSTSNQDSTVVSATTEIFTGWTGQLQPEPRSMRAEPRPRPRHRRRPRRRCRRRPRRPAASCTSRRGCSAVLSGAYVWDESEPWGWRIVLKRETEFSTSIRRARFQVLHAMRGN